MKQATHDALANFLDSRLSIEGAGNIWDVLDSCREVRTREGRDAPELTLRTSELLALLEQDLTPDEYERAKGIVLADYDQAQDAVIRTVKAMDEYRRAVAELRPFLGEAVHECQDTASIYRSALGRMGLDAAHAPLDAARAIYRQIGAGSVHLRDKAASEELAKRFGATSARRRADRPWVKHHVTRAPGWNARSWICTAPPGYGPSVCPSPVR